MQYTISLEKCVDLGWHFITDEEYNAEDENLALVNLSPKKVYDDLIDYYIYYDIAFETIQRFGFEFRRIWDVEYPRFSKMCAMASKIDKDKLLNDFTHTYDTTSNGTTDFSDTPNENMYADSEETIPKYLTNRTKAKATTNIEDAQSRNPYEAYSRYSKYIANIEYDFIRKFNNLFSTYIPIKDTPYPQRGIPTFIAWRTYK